MMGFKNKIQFSKSKGGKSRFHQIHSFGWVFRLKEFEAGDRGLLEGVVFEASLSRDFFVEDQEFAQTHQPRHVVLQHWAVDAEHDEQLIGRNPLAIGLRLADGCCKIVGGGFDFLIGDFELADTQFFANLRGLDQRVAVARRHFGDGNVEKMLHSEVGAVGRYDHDAGFGKLENVFGSELRFFRGGRGDGQSEATDGEAGGRQAGDPGESAAESGRHLAVLHRRQVVSPIHYWFKSSGRSIRLARWIGLFRVQDVDAFTHRVIMYPSQNKPRKQEREDPLLREIQYVKGVGPHRYEWLKKLGLATVRDVLYYFPRRFEDRTAFTRLIDLKPAERATSMGRLIDIRAMPLRGRRMIVKALLSDGTAQRPIVWFADYVLQFLKPGYLVVITGPVKLSRGVVQFEHPREIEVIDKPEGGQVEYGGRPRSPASGSGRPGMGGSGGADTPGGSGDDPQDSLQQRTPPPLRPDMRQAPLNFGRLVPYYGLTERLTQKLIRSVAYDCLLHDAVAIPETLPEEILTRRNLMGASRAVCHMHFPDSLKTHAEAVRRFAYEELFFLSLGFGQRRRQDDGQGPAKSIRVNELVDTRIRKRIPFDLTAAQNTALQEILEDLRGSRPMNRLLQGDVGVGKSAVAVYILLATVAAHAQAVYMAPTTILAEQFCELLRHYLQGSQVNIELLSGAVGPAERARILERAQSGDVHILAGTHAVLNEKLQFKDLRLVVIDEQHKFGVRQRLELRSKGYRPHLLTMTSTPIPRTLALTLYGDIALSRITTAPAGRGKTETKLVNEEDRKSIYELIRKEIKKGGQAYVVVPAVGEGALLAPFDVEEAPPEPALIADVKTEGGLVNAQALSQHLADDIFPDMRIGLLHGRMNSDEKSRVMNAFRLRMIDVLVTTVVIEVGVDVPNANVMVIEQGERFGLSTLHQLRGRIGRGERNSVCAVFAEATTPEAQERLKLFASTTDGFKIAEGDYQLRRSGRLFGTEQSGESEMVIADLVRDESLLQEARADAERLLEADPALRTVPSGLRAKLIKIFKHRLELGDI